MKRIALVGNMNNNFFAITRYLRDEGYDAHLFYRLAADHFQPLADTYCNDYQSYCHEVNWLNNSFHNVDCKRVVQQLSGFDFYIGQGEEAAVAYYCGFKMNIYYPYGSDIYKYAHLPQEYTFASKIVSLISNSTNRPTYRQMKVGTMAKYLKGVIINADYVFTDVTNDEYANILSELGCKGKIRNVAMPFIYASEYEKLNTGYTTDTSYKHSIQKIRDKHDFVVLYHGRQEWKTYHNQFTGKSTDNLIKGFAEFIRSIQNVNACLVMLEYGSDVQASKELIKELDIENYVYWFPKMYRKELMFLVKTADVCCGEFAHSFLTFGTIIEAMLMKRPVITYRDDSYYMKTYPELYPCFNAKTHIEIAKQLETASKNKTETVRMGEKAHDWVIEYFINKPLQSLLDVIKNG